MKSSIGPIETDSVEETAEMDVLARVGVTLALRNQQEQLSEVFSHLSLLMADKRVHLTTDQIDRLTEAVRGLAHLHRETVDVLIRYLERVGHGNTGQKQGNDDTGSSGGGATQRG